MWTFNASVLYGNGAVQQIVCVCSPRVTGCHSKLVIVDLFRREPSGCSMGMENSNVRAGLQGWAGLG